MRLPCEISISNRLSEHLNVREKNYSCTASVSLGRKNNEDQELYFMVSTARNRNGRKYKIKDNIENIFKKYVDEGKFSVQFKEPPHTVFIKKADPVLLKTLINALKHNEYKGNHVPLLVSASTVQVTKKPRKLEITSRSQYPAFGQSFPQTLECLIVNFCDLKRVDRRILKICNLRVINLSNNKLTEIDDKFGQNFPNLIMLNLSHNMLTTISGEFFSNFKHSLVRLDISHNHIQVLPHELCTMRKLACLNCSNNQLTKLPGNIGALPSLNMLLASHNKLTAIPCSMKRLKLIRLDLSPNNFRPLANRDHIPSRHNFSVLSLLERAAISVKKHNLKYGDSDLPFNLINYLKSVKWCSCGKPCFESYVFYQVAFDLRRISSEIVTSVNSNRIVPMEMIACSLKCLRYN